MVFHDLTLERLIEAEGPVAAHEAAALKQLRYRNVGGSMIDLADLLDLVGGRVPLLIEIKSEWDAPDSALSCRRSPRRPAPIAGPIALMSFDPAVMAGNTRAGAADPPRHRVGAICRRLLVARQARARARLQPRAHLLESGPAAPDFYAYDVTALPTPVTRFAREVLGLPLFTWTVRTEEQRDTAARWADAPIFEGYEP